LTSHSGKRKRPHPEVEPIKHFLRIFSHFFTTPKSAQQSAARFAATNLARPEGAAKYELCLTREHLVKEKAKYYKSVIGSDISIKSLKRKT
jgi:hypothetical protein